MVLQTIEYRAVTRPVMRQTNTTSTMVTGTGCGVKKRAERIVAKALAWISTPGIARSRAVGTWNASVKPVASEKPINTILSWKVRGGTRPCMTSANDTVRNVCVSGRSVNEGGPA